MQIGSYVGSPMIIVPSVLLTTVLVLGSGAIQAEATPGIETNSDRISVTNAPQVVSGDEVVDMPRTAGGRALGYNSFVGQTMGITWYDIQHNSS